MRSFVTRLCLPITALTLTTAIQAHGPQAAKSVPSNVPSTARHPVAIVDAFHRSLKSGNLTAASDLLADDVLIYESGGAEHSKAEYLEHHLPADIEFSKATTRTVTRRSAKAEDNFAWVATESRTTGGYKGRAIDSSSTETMMLRRFGEVWKIVHIHWSSGK